MAVAENALASFFLQRKRFFQRFMDAGRTIAADKTYQSGPIAFMHIPKTCGTALTSSLRQSLLPSAALLNCFDHSLFGTFDDFASFDENLRRQIYGPQNMLPGQAEFVAGHMAFSTLRAAYPDAAFVTVLREPHCRLLSLWLFWRRHTDADLQAWARWADRVKISRQPLAAFLSDPTLACQTDNVALRMLLWPNPLIRGDRFIDEADDPTLLRAAIARLAEFSFAGIVEDENLAARLRHWLNRPFELTRENQATSYDGLLRTRLIDEVNPLAHGLLGHRSRLDSQLWMLTGKRHLPEADMSTLREFTILANFMRHGALLAGQDA
jgi:hypothetical protein